MVSICLKKVIDSKNYLSLIRKKAFKHKVIDETVYGCSKMTDPQVRVIV
jgi:hypothetical protein